MAGMYPDNQTLEVFDKPVIWPGVNSEGKFTNGDFNDPLVPPSYIPADTINLVVDNLNTLVTSMGGEPNNTEEEQLASLFSAAATAHKGIKRDANGRAEIEVPTTQKHIANKEYVDVEAKAHSDADTAEAKARGEADVAETNARINADTAEAQARADADTAEAKARSDANNALQRAIDKLIPVGMIIPSPSSSVAGFLPCSGATILRADFPKLNTFMATLPPTYSYGMGDGSTTFRLPPFNSAGAFLRGKGGNAEAIGIPQGDAIRNIIGSVGGAAVSYGQTFPGSICFVEGCFKFSRSAPEIVGAAGRDQILGYLGATFDASLSVGTDQVAAENRPVNQSIYYHIKY